MLSWSLQLKRTLTGSGRHSRLFSNACPVELTALFQAFRALMGTLSAQGTGELPASGVFASCPLHVECLDVDVTADELLTCIKRTKRGKGPGLGLGIDGILAEMIKDGDDLLESCLLLLSIAYYLIAHY